jgi:outer membrane lipoprotein-sorting protein
MRFKTGYILIFVALFALTAVFASFKSTDSADEKSTRELIDKIFESINNVKTLRYSLQCNERIKGRMQHTESKVKLQISPRKLYLNIRGVEVLWVQGANNGEALVNPNAFPYVNLNLDTYGSLMRKDQHHTIHEMGYQYLAEILKDGLRWAGDNVDKYVKVLGEEKHNGRDCYQLSISFPDFAWENYTVKKNENITSIARKLHVSEYMVLENNPKLSSYHDVKEGQVIRVPNAYAKLTLLLIDKEYFLPVNNKVFDDKGLYETYEYFNLQVNSYIAPEEFTKTYKDYHF